MIGLIVLAVVCSMVLTLWSLWTFAKAVWKFGVVCGYGYTQLPDEFPESGKVIRECVEKVRGKDRGYE